MKTQIASIETEPAGDEWRATLWLRGVAGIHRCEGEGKTQCAAIAAACLLARENLGREFVPASGDQEKDFQDWCGAMEALADLHGGS